MDPLGTVLIVSQGDVAWSAIGDMLSDEHGHRVLPDELPRSELFGHQRGACTGAMSDRLGLFCSSPPRQPPGVAPLGHDLTRLDAVIPADQSPDSSRGQ